MPVKPWLEERRFLQAEMQRLRDKLAISERTGKAEAQLKDKLKLWLKSLEEGLKHESSFSANPNAFCGSPKHEKSNSFFGILANNTRLIKRSTSQPRAFIISRSSPQQPNVENDTTNAAGELKRVNSFKKKYTSGENLLRKSLWASRSKVVDSGGKENTEMKGNMVVNVNKLNGNETVDPSGIKTKGGGNEVSQNMGSANSDSNDLVSGFLYDRFQKEFISLKKSCEVKDSSLNAKDEEIKMLIKKVDTLTRAIEVESKKMKREAAMREKESMSAKGDDDKRMRNAISSKSWVTKAS